MRRKGRSSRSRFHRLTGRRRIRTCFHLPLSRSTRPRMKSSVRAGQRAAPGSVRDAGTAGNFASACHSAAPVPYARNVSRRTPPRAAALTRATMKHSTMRHNNARRRRSIRRCVESIHALSASWRSWSGGTPGVGPAIAVACGSRFSTCSRPSWSIVNGSSNS